MLRGPCISRHMLQNPDEQLPGAVREPGRMAAGGHGGFWGRVDVGISDSPMELSFFCFPMF